MNLTVVSALATLTVMMLSGNENASYWQELSHAKSPSGTTMLASWAYASHAVWRISGGSWKTMTSCPNCMGLIGLAALGISGNWQMDPKNGWNRLVKRES